ncbi:MAG: FtsQ-type POTRA domain-containing protein [Bacilli bacterium]|nr:FtsQ-type POTRA domain-containing protein [Bacilli bacterium]
MEQVKKRKLNFKKIFIALLLIYLIIYLFSTVIRTSIKNIYIFGEDKLSEQEVLELAKIDNYPSCFLTSTKSIKKKILGSPYVKDVKVEKKWFCTINIHIEENKKLFIKRSDQKLVLENGLEIKTDNKVNNVPLLINYVPEKVYKGLISKMSLINDSILSKVSEIEYNPNDLDDERFLLSMGDGNYVYVTLFNFDSLNYYLETLPKLEGKKGILYFDVGNYFEIIE